MLKDLKVLAVLKKKQSKSKLKIEIFRKVTIRRKLLPLNFQFLNRKM